MVEYQKYIQEIKKYAVENNVPIMEDEGMNFLTTFVIKNQGKSVLEIGTAIGYSAIMMALCQPSIRITSIEKDEVRYLEALKNIKKFHLENRITLIFNDALDVRLDEEFDIVTDNIYFHGLVEKNEKEIKSHNLRGLVRKIKEYIAFLNDNPDFDTVVYRVGDGIAVSKRKV